MGEGGMTVCDKVCPGMALTSGLFSCDKRQFSLADETAQQRIMTLELLLEILSLGR